MPPQSTFQRVVREPLLQFMLLGALLFIADRNLPKPADNPRRIVIDADRRAELVAIFEEGQGRSPTPEEMQDLIVTWSQNEVLYREARLMGLDRGDEMIRQRLILKLRNIVFGNVVVPTPNEAELRAWFEAHRDQFDRPERYDFEQFALGEDPGQRAQAQALASELGRGDAPAERVDDVRRYAARPRENLSDLFGEEDAARMLAQEGAWVVVDTDRGVHLARVTARHPAAPAEFDTVRSRVARGWKEDARKASLSESLKAIVEQFEIVVAPDAPRSDAPDTTSAGLAGGDRVASPSAAPASTTPTTDRAGTRTASAQVAP